jgi:CheY-like chemotaxis protein
MPETPIPRSVLVVDDSGIFGFTLSLEFRRAGWSVYCCGSAEDALKKLEETSFDLLLSDVFMPGLKGTDLAEVVKDKYPRMRVILTSSMPRERLPALPKGVAFLPKPVNVTLIVQAFEAPARGATPPPPPK